MSNDFEAKLSAVVGKTAWGATLGNGSFLTVEFGERVAQPDGNVHGEFHLWVYCSAWRIESSAAVLAGSEDAREALAVALRQLDGKTVSAIAVESPSLSATLSFSDGTTLKTFSVFSTEADHWMLYLPGGEVFTAGPGTTWSLGV